MSRNHVAAALVALAAVLCAGSASAQTGSITGRVTRSDTQQPLDGVQVFVAGTNRGGITNQDGRFLIQSVPSGSHVVRASLIGYTQGEQTVSVSAGQPATADFQLRETAVELGGIVVNAVTGQVQTKREVANAVGTIDMKKVELAPVTNMSELIQGRVAGAVVLQSGGTTGGGARIRIRGSNSISLSNAPLIVVDGVRVESSENSLGFGVGGQAPSRLNDLNPEDIENIDILKGPAASSLYGTAAANGVIVVTTRRGRSGAPQFRFWGETGSIDRTTDYPENVAARGLLVGGAGVTVAPGTVGRCDFIRLGQGATPAAGQVGCTGVTETHRFNPLENTETSPFRDGSRYSFGGSGSGGSDNARFYVSGEYEQESGVMSENELRRIRVQTNLNGDVGTKVSLGASFSFLETNMQLPLGDNALFGIVSMGLFGSALPAALEATQGFESDPEFHYDWRTFQDFSRFTGSVRGDYRPLPWLTAHGTVGLDRYAREEINRLPRISAYNVFGSVYEAGFIQDYDYDIYNVTANGAASAIFNPTEDLVSTTSIGTSYTKEDFKQIYAFGATLTPGIETSLAGATTDFEVGEANVLNATLGAYVQQQFAWRDRVFLNAAVRTDKNTAFGTDIGWIAYPAVSAAWVVSEETFFPQLDFLSTLRLRAAWGQSGLRPGATDALQSFSSAIGVFQNEPVPAIVINEVGNAELKPERSTELELGFDSGFFDGRLGLEFTAFQKVSKDALVNKPLPPSLGASASRFENLGEVRNRGLELLLNATPVQTSDIRWGLTLSGSVLENELVDLGKDNAGQDIPTIVFGAQRHAEGYPLGGYWHFPIVSFDDANNDGRLTGSEVVVDRDTVAFLGNPFPTREFSFSTDVGFRSWLRVNALLDYKGGHHILNYTRAWRCGDRFNCAELFATGIPLEEQAAIVARAVHRSYTGFVEKADFMKLREVGLTIGLPTSLAERVRAQRLTLTLAARNVATWTDYKGFDPEVAWSGQANFTSGDFTTLPPNRYFTIRLDTNF
jgi:TonB-linked SusC/RagA family outer membrane protein